MNPQKVYTTYIQNLRQKAEEQLGKKPQSKVSKLSEAEVLKVIHELEVHQLELDLQYEELLLAKKKETLFTVEKIIELNDFASSGYFLLSREGEILNVSHYGAIILATDQTHLKDSRFDFFVADDSKPVFNQFLEKVFSSNEKKSCEIVLSVHGRLEINVLLTAIVTGNGEQCMLNVVNITEPSRTEDVLRENERFLKEIQTLARLGTYTLEISSGKWRSSEMLDVIFGIDSDYDKSIDGWVSIIHADWQKAMNDYFIREVIGKKINFDKEYKITRQNDQSERWVHGIGRIEFDDSDQPVKMIGAIRDITEQKMAEEELRKQQLQYDNLVSKIPVGVYILHSKPEGSFALDYVSPKMAEMLNLSAESLLDDAQTIFKAIYPDDLEGFMKLNQEGIYLRRPFDWTGRMQVDGTLKWMHFRSTPELLDSGDVLWHGLIVDITQHILTETEIKSKNEELQRLNTEKDKYLSILAHDFRGPFSGFLELTKMMAEGSSEMTMAQVQKSALVMKKSAANLYHLIENLLEWSRMQRGLIGFTPSSFLLFPYVKETTGLVQEAADKKEISVSYEIPEDLLIFADENMLGSIIRNLAANAVKFTPHGGSIQVSAKRGTENSVTISVRDTGIGMDKALINKLFKLGENTSRLGTEGEPSTGLGLIICKDFIEKHGGVLEVESEPAIGSIFYFTIPGNLQPESKTAITERVSAGMQVKKIENLKILIAEDEETADLLITIALRKIAREFLHAKTGMQAVEICRNNPDIDLVLMDIQMPEMDGYEATRQIRQFNSDIVIIAQTAYAYSGESDKAIEAGCNGYISKPIDQVELLRLIGMYF